MTCKERVDIKLIVIPDQIFDLVQLCKNLGSFHLWYQRNTILVMAGKKADAKEKEDSSDSDSMTRGDSRRIPRSFGTKFVLQLARVHKGGVGVVSCVLRR